MLLDDAALSALDGEGQAAFHRVLGSSFAGMTRVVVARRLDTIRRCDTLLLLEGGQVARFGPTEDMLGGPGSSAIDAIEGGILGGAAGGAGGAQGNHDDDEEEEGEGDGNRREPASPSGASSVGASPRGDARGSAARGSAARGSAALSVDFDYLAAGFSTFMPQSTPRDRTGSDEAEPEWRSVLTLTGQGVSI